MAYKVAVIPGDGIGPEVTAAAVEVLQATGVAFDFTEYPAGDWHLEAHGVALPQATIDGAKASQATLFGAVGYSAAQVILKLRAELGTWVNLRPAFAYEGVKCLYPGLRMVIVRENTEGMYKGIEAEIVPGVRTMTRVITRHASERIARFAMQYAKDNGYEKVTAIHKNNVLIQTDGLFVECCRKVAQEFPEVKYEEGLVDSVAMRMVLKPTDFQVMVTTNLFGDILSDLAAGLIGGLGMCPSANLGDDNALFEPVHGSAPDIAGQNKANPAAAILCGAMLLRYFGETAAAERVEGALEKAIAEGQVTGDLGGKLNTQEMAQAVMARMGA